MFKWLPYPMVRIAAFFTGGVLLGIYFSDHLSFNLAIGPLTFCLIGFFALKFYSEENRLQVATGFFGLSAVLLMGLSRLFLFTDMRDENHVSKIKDEITAYEAVVRSVPEEKAKSWKIELEMTAVKTDRWQPAKEKMLLYVSKNNFSPSSFHYGDKILVKGNPQEIKSPSNPGEFDFKRFLSFKSISRQQFVLSDNIKFIASASRKGFIYYSHQARGWSIKKLNEFIHGNDERAIAIALVLGVTDGVDNDLQNAYAASGAMHVLAVSGMHVGIIYAIILFLFRPFHQYQWSKWVIAVSSLILLWAFAFVTGLSPSVLRAVTMFSFIALARPFGKQTNIYNTLAASAFVLLLYNPYLIMSVGFQLSYLAVLGIVYLQRPIYSLWNIDNAILDWIWKATSISIAAQVATFALGLFYFHQFPTYFLISNLFVIPLSTMVLVVGIFLLIISFISPLAYVVALVLEWLVQGLNWIVFKTEALPFSLINNIYISAFQCWILIGILFTLFLLFETKSIKWLYIAFGLVLIFVSLQWQHFFNEVDEKELIAYNINNHQAAELIDRGQSFFMTDSSLQHDTERIRFHIEPNRLAHGVSIVHSANQFEKQVNGAGYLRWQNRTIGWIGNKTARIPTNVVVDCLIVSHNSLSRKVLPKLNLNTIIFDGSNSKNYVQSLTKELAGRNIQTYSTSESGAYIF